MSIDLKFVALTDDVLDFFFYKMVIHELTADVLEIFFIKWSFTESGY